MMNEHSGKMEINITHDLSNIENLRKINRINFSAGDFLFNAVVEIRGLEHDNGGSL
jgi:hypothetical protein